MASSFCFFFFFQAEDGIRDVAVTGVQTCALPIFLTKNGDVGEVVAPLAASAFSKSAVVTIADLRSLQVEADVAESNLEAISLDQPCEIVLDAYPDVRYPAVVARIVPTADRAKATVQG